MSEMHRGFKQALVIVHTGDGKGKTTAALGLAMRAVGHGLRVLMIQFLKSNKDTGEALSARRIDGLEIRTMGTGFVIGEWTQADIAAAHEAWHFACDAVRAGEHDMVILDEITYPVNAGVIATGELVELTQKRPPGVTLVLTGRDAPDEIIQVADLVTEMQCVKHPYERGIKAQEGIEY